MRAAGMRVVAVQGAQWEQDKANAVAAALLREHPDLKAILASNDSMALGAAAAVRQSGAGRPGAGGRLRQHRGRAAVARRGPHPGDGGPARRSTRRLRHRVRARDSSARTRRPRIGRRRWMWSLPDRRPTAARCSPCEGWAKAYAVPVLTGVDLDFRAGEVHALMGANGAGKSTLVRIVCGLTTADRGAMTLAGQPHAPTSRRAAEDAGVRVVLQELNLIETLSVAENLFLARLPHRFGLLDQRVAARARHAGAGAGGSRGTGSAHAGSRRSASGSGNWSRSRRHWRATAACSCSTSPPPH